MNYLIPVYNRTLSKQRLQYNKEDLNTIIDQQILICQLSNGISYSDTDAMDEYERLYTLNKLIQLKKEELEAKQKAYEEAKNG